jgi:GDP-L-fucose synthase
MLNFLHNFNRKSFLITGGTGFVGKNLAPFLCNIGANVITSGRNFDLSIDNKAESLFAQISHPLDYIIHGASLQAAGEWPLKHRADQYDINLRINANVFKMWKKYQPQAKMIGIGSSCSYPGHLTLLKETDYWAGPLHESVDIYGFTKKAVSVGIEAYKNQHGLKGTTVVFATLYGPHDHFDPEKSHVVSALIKKFVDACQYDLPSVEVWGDGSQTRELIYIDDQIAGLLAVANYDGPIINIGTGTETTVSNLAETIKKLSGFKGNIIYNTARFVGAYRKVLDVSLARDQFGWTSKIPLTPMETGLIRTINWYREHMK